MLRDRIQDEKIRTIQVLFGPRQVGKTTLARQLAEHLGWPYHMASADAVGTAAPEWIALQWERARLLRSNSAAPTLLILDEVQKIAQWSEHVKKYWDEDRTEGRMLRVVILGSSPLLMQRGLTESLAGRFEIIPVTHWSYSEMLEAFGMTLEDYLIFGGYPGAFEFIKDPMRWSQYILDSLVETTLSRDIFLMTRIDKPALFRQLFELGCRYSGQILSLQKIQGQLQDAGNTSTLAGYLQTMEGARLLTGLSKFSKNHVRRKASSPKLQVFNNALLNAWEPPHADKLKNDSETWGRIVESAVGAHLINHSYTDLYKLSYWNEGSSEIDFIIEKGKQIIALEVKSGRRTGKVGAYSSFKKVYSEAKYLVIGTGGIPFEEFFAQTPATLFKL
jgi:predicted AAA+ superfamily ATPase